MTINLNDVWLEPSMILLDRASRRPEAFAEFHPEVVSTVTAVHESIAHAAKKSVWVSYDRHLTTAFVEHAVSCTSPFAIGVFIHALDTKIIPVLQSLFRRIAFSVDDGFISAEELAEVLQSPNRANLFVGGFVNGATKSITFWRGSFESLTVPFSAFEVSGDGTAPDFNSFSVIDCGQTVKLGEYEAAVDAILYEHDSEFRRSLSKKRLNEEKSFGASLRRLRKQRGLSREDFQPDISAKTVARIEQGQGRKVQKATLQALAKRLGVEPEEIETF